MSEYFFYDGKLNAYFLKVPGNPRLRLASRDVLSIYAAKSGLERMMKDYRCPADWIEKATQESLEPLAKAYRELYKRTFQNFKGATAAAGGGAAAGSLPGIHGSGKPELKTPSPDGGTSMGAEGKVTATKAGSNAAAASALQWMREKTDQVGQLVREPVKAAVGGLALLAAGLGVIGSGAADALDQAVATRPAISAPVAPAPVAPRPDRSIYEKVRDGATVGKIDKTGDLMPKN